MDGATARIKARTKERSAPWIPVDQRSIVSIEHPGIIKNFDKGIQTLGGSSRLAKSILGDNASDPVRLSFHPEDPTCKPIMSNLFKSENILLKITVPRRTGRKRKRGSTEPFEGPAIDAMNEDISIARHEFLTSQSPDIRRPAAAEDGVVAVKSAGYIVRSMSDNPTKCHVETTGKILQIHRFRNLPDFQYSTAKSPFAQRFKDQLLSYDFEKIKQFKLGAHQYPAHQIDLIPPPSFSHVTVPFSYSYRQNPAVKQKIDKAGKVIMFNTQAPMKIRTIVVPCDGKTVPTGPSKELPPLESLGEPVQRLAKKMLCLMDERPIWTRRAIISLIDEQPNSAIFKTALQYIGYMFRSGPWRDSFVRFGLDPRSDVKYRIYQTFHFQLEPKEALPGLSSKTTREEMIGKPPGTIQSHIFDGTHAYLDGRTWQVCDISYPIVANILATTNLRPECDVYCDGWFWGGTMAKTKAIMKCKLDVLYKGDGPSEEEIMQVAGFPEIMTKENRAQFFFEGPQTKYMTWMAAEVRRQGNNSVSQKRLMKKTVRWSELLQGSERGEEEGEGEEQKEAMNGETDDVEEKAE